MQKFAGVIFQSQVNEVPGQLLKNSRRIRFSNAHTAFCLFVYLFILWRSSNVPDSITLKNVTHLKIFFLNNPTINHSLMKQGGKTKDYSTQYYSVYIVQGEHSRWFLQQRERKKEEEEKKKEEKIEHWSAVQLPCLMTGN